MMYALESLRAIIDNLDVRGKVFGYNVKPSNFQFIKKENHRENSIKVFEGTNITMVVGFGVLGLVIGTPSECNKYMEAKLKIQLPKQKSFPKKLKHHPKMHTPARQRKFKMN